MITPVRITAAQIGTSASAIYTCPSGTRAIVKRIVLANDTTTVIKPNLYLVPSGGSAGVTNIILNQKKLGSNESYSCPEFEGLVLQEGDSIQGTATTAAQVTIQGGLIEIV